jgi:hypothetical protein
MGARVWKKPFLCRIGLHSDQAAAPATRYAVEVQCERCGRRKILPLNTSRDQGGGGHA